MKRILITGASGYVGRAFIKTYGRDYKFRVFGRTAVIVEVFGKLTKILIRGGHHEITA